MNTLPVAPEPEPGILRWPAWLRRWLKQHESDPFPSLPVPATGGDVVDGVAYDGRAKPDFVQADDEGWRPV